MVDYGEEEARRIFSRGSARAKKAVGRASRREHHRLEYVPALELRTFDQVAEASIEKNREVLRELAKY